MEAGVRRERAARAQILRDGARGEARRVNGAGVGAPASVDLSPTPADEAFEARRGAPRSTTGRRLPNASRVGASTARGSVAASSIAELARSAEGGGHGAVLLANDEKGVAV